MAMEVKIHKKLGEYELDVHWKSTKKRIGILGASGSGKSLTLKSIAGIEHPDQGHIQIGDHVLYDSDSRICLKPQKRNVGYMFQNYALFPTMTVEQNVGAGLAGNKKKKQEQVPKLSIQPLAENALYHGIKNRRGKGKITITGREEADAIVLTVSDNGQGMTPERLHEVQESIRTGERAGFGLAAVAERIALYYGPGYGMTISSKEGEGTTVELRLGKNIQPKS